MKVKFEDKTYEVVERNCDTLRIKNKEEEFCISIKDVIIQNKKMAKDTKSDPRP